MHFSTILTLFSMALTGLLNSLDNRRPCTVPASGSQAAETDKCSINGFLNNHIEITAYVGRQPELLIEY